MSDTAPDSITGYRCLDRVVLAVFVLLFGFTFIHAGLTGPARGPPDWRMVGYSFISAAFWVAVIGAICLVLGLV